MIIKHDNAYRSFRTGPISAHFMFNKLYTIIIVTTMATTTMVV